MLTGAAQGLWGWEVGSQKASWVWSIARGGEGKEMRNGVRAMLGMLRAPKPEHPERWAGHGTQGRGLIGATRCPGHLQCHQMGRAPPVPPCPCASIPYPQPGKHPWLCEDAPHGHPSSWGSRGGDTSS